MQDLTFKPQISMRASRIHRDSSMRNSIENQLIQYGKLIHEKHEHLRIEHRMQEKQRYDFKPKINKLSQIISQQKESTVHEENLETSSFENSRSPAR